MGGGGDGGMGCEGWSDGFGEGKRVKGGGGDQCVSEGSVPIASPIRI